MNKKPKGLLETLGGASADLPHIFEAQVDGLQPNPYQPRQSFDQKGLRELADSIEQHGLIHPIAVMPGPEEDTYVIVSGERRTRAFQLLNRATIPAILTDGDPEQLAVIENIQREDLHPLDLAEKLEQMAKRHGFKQQELARTIGKSVATVSELLRLNRLADPIKQEFRTSEIPKSVALLVSREKDPQKQQYLWKLAKKGLTVREARAAKKPSPPRPADVLALTAGERFVRSLAKLSPDSDLDALRAIRKQIDEFFDSHT